MHSHLVLGARWNVVGSNLAPHQKSANVAIRVAHLTESFAVGITVVNDLSFAVSRGLVKESLGPHGSGGFSG